MENSVLILIIFLLSIGSGIIGSLLGLGGGAIVIPLLTLLLGIDIREAIGASIVSVIATSCSAVAAYANKRIINFRIALFLLTATTTGAIFGTFAAGYFNPRFLYLLFAIVLGFSCIVLFRRRHIELPERPPPCPVAAKLQLGGCCYDQALQQEVSYAPARSCLSYGIMFFAGIVSGILGIGNGVFTVLTMDAVMSLPMKVAMATNNLTIGVTVAVSSWIYYARGYINPFIAGPVAIGVFIGARLGARLMIRLKNTTLRKIFVPVLFYAAVQMFIRGLKG